MRKSPAFAGRTALPVAGVLAAATVAGWLLWPETHAPAPAGYAGPIHDIFQPSAEQQKQLLRSITVDNAADRSRQIVDGLPYSYYTAVENPAERVVHPAVVGRVLHDLSLQDPKAGQEFAALAEKIATQLPNGGNAWYYPRQIKTARLLGPDVKYSAMAAGDLLGGYTALALSLGFDKVPGLDAAFKALTFPWEQGGVSFGGRALLELPLFRSPPEIVLNGWLHALVELSDYAELSHNPEAVAFLKSNIDFLAATLPSYDAPEVGLSRYSDTSPYSVVLTYQSDRVPDFSVRYQPLLEGLEPIDYSLRMQDQTNGVSFYDNQIVKADANRMSALVSCNSKYRTIVRSRDVAFRAVLFRGQYDWESTVPGQAGEKLELTSTPGIDGWNEVTIDPAALKLICGYPTNFSKAGGKNYYHVQHFVGLLYVAAIVPMEDETRCTLSRWAFRWRDYARTTKAPEGLSFTDAQTVLAGLNACKPLTQFTSVETLYEQSESWFAGHCQGQQ
jgi:hypothetical protein